MRSNRLHLVAFFACLLFFSCTRKTEDFTLNAHLNEYMPIQVGKYTIYRLDSTVFTNFGSTVAVHSYQEKQIVDAQVTDAQGRNSYHILRLIRDTAGTQPWAPAAPYFITPTDSAIEVNENNLRFVKLVLPISQDYTWKGNHYLPDNAYKSMFSFNSNFRMNDWDYTYTSIDSSLSINGHTYNDVVTIDGIDDVFNADVESASVISPSTFASVNYFQEKYSKGVGLVSQQLIIWEYQPPNAANPAGSQVGFGVKRTILDHN